MKRFKKQGAGYRVQGTGSSTPNPFLLFAFLFLLSSFLFAFAVTYRVDPANGPDTLPTEVKEAFDAWVALSDKIEVSETEENPEGVFQYGDPARFGEDILSLTVQRQGDTRSIIYLISPNAENRKRILLHETGIAIGLTPQIPGTPLQNVPTPTPPAEGTEPPTGEGQETFETTPLPETTPTEPSGEATTEGSSDTTSEPSEGTTGSQNTTQEQGTTTSDSSTEQTTDTQSSEEQPAAEGTSEETTPPEGTETPTQALTPNSVMNPSISPDDSVELGEFEKQLVEQLQLFASEDINRDGVVNFYDLVALSQAFGRSGVNDPADINKDGVIDQADVDELRNSYTFSDPSETPPGGSTSSTTPDTTPPEGTDDPSPSEGTPPDNGTPPTNDSGQPSGDGSGE